MKLNKSLGQNFFNNPNLADWIVEQVATENPGSIIEIGPGDGYFTKRLLNVTSNITAIEKDSELAKFLKQKVPSIQVINEDILKINFNPDNYTQPLVLYGSLPYNISKPIITQFVQYSEIKAMFFIVQKEVAEKYISKDGKSSILSILTSFFADVEILKYIKPGNFIPKPKVDSALIKITPREIDKTIDINRLTTIVKKAFGNPRKTLRNNLRGYNLSGIPEDILNKRPENLRASDFKAISNQIVL
ncbi:MAG: Ribosomal RNA small subunit methyltransferase A [candidate division WS6 bacterium GW2011_GWF2_39_15]|uniref:Ribosomal RNA small subunit methyltransferase A n=1 Tax=candidate division WS6 bacterium GW2011_GWF2_39_15 TaxID=1619100 RepID=A0A0G0MYA3_9BACT|nr:MAG: Ribosomal RNA small subunit methyltransferase A [candidate division WS6 bacterium GW2011_GWF2_39_15]